MLEITPTWRPCVVLFLHFPLLRTLMQRKAADSGKNAKVDKHPNPSQTRTEREEVKLSGYLFWDWREQGYLQVGEYMQELLLLLYWDVKQNLFIIARLIRKIVRF